MPSKKSYNRFFIILQEEQKGYGIDSNKTPSGYAKLEMRNERAKTSFYIQDIKKQNGPYHMILIAQNDNGSKELINLGQVNINESGKADVSSEHDANNIANTNIAMEKVQGAGICRISGTKVSPIMVGFICGEELKNWSTYPMAKAMGKSTKLDMQEKKVQEATSEMKNIKQEKKIEEKKIEEKKSEVKETKIAECIKAKKEVRDEETLKQKEIHKECNLSGPKDCQNFDEYEEQIERLKVDRKKYNNNCGCQDEDKDKNHKENLNKEMEHHHEEHHKDDFKEELKGPMGDFFKDIVKDLEMLGHKEQVKNCSWYKVKVDNLDNMYSMNDYNKYSVIFYPMICYYPYISKHKHFMIGYKSDDEGNLKYIIYAIPGTKALVDQPYEGKTGFVTFMDEDEDCINGYWMMYYDVKKNSVVVPVKKSK